MTASRGVSIELRGLSVQAGRTTILGPLDLSVEAGEQLLLVGASGSGKSTLLRAIAGLAVPHTGHVSLGGEEVSRPGKLVVRPERRGVGMLFQGGALWPHLSVRRTLGFVLARAGVKGAAASARIAELLAEVELAGFEDRMPATLSGGERQRLALARALGTGAGGPRILLLDEPLGPLDAELRAALLRNLAALHAKFGWTVIHVTHDPEEARGSATRVARLAGGSLVSIEEGGES